MAKKSKNSELLVYYARTMTPENLSRAANYVGGYVLRGLGALGKIFTVPLTGGPTGTNTVPLYPRTVLLANAERKLRETQEKLIGKAMTWISPLNYGAALATGNGLNARKGEEEVASWSPAWQAAARLGELYVGPKGVKAAKAAPRTVVNTAAKARVKPAKAAVVAREIKQGIKLNTKNGRIEVTGNYFNSSDKWYRITETPEKYGIMELNKNVTTHDASQTYGTINGWRSSMLKAPITKSSEGFIKRPQKIELGIRRKNGQAHGNTSQAAKGKLWGGTTSGSNLFPEGIIEGQAPSMINYGIDRTNFVITPWELVPNGGRVGFHTGEMPMSNLGWFQRTNKGTYTYEPIIPEKRITYHPILLLNSPTSLAFFEKKPSTILISPEELYKVLKDQELNGYYFMGHGTGRSNVNPQIIFDNGLRIKNGDIGNTTSPISLSNLSLWPHANSKEIIILPGKAGNVKFDSAHGRIPSDWYDSKIFQWNDNPGFEGSGLFAVLKPNATFVETEINGVPGVYTKPEAILGSYNIDTHTLKLNPRSLYKFFKQGGKMNILEFLKNGSGIHIKEKNKGSFTRWCGGNVTEECIRKGKASSNPKIRKKATFADNARHFKHKKGGKAFVEGVNVLDSNPKMSKAASRRVKKHLYGGDINNPNAMGGAAFTSWINYQMRLPELLKLREERKQQELLLEQLKLMEKSEKLNSILGTVSDFGYLALGKLLNKKSTNKIDNGTPSTTNFWNTPTIKNSQVTGDFWNNPTIANSIA